MRLFGWEILRKKEIENANLSFAPRVDDDGAVMLQSASGSFASYIDLTGTVRTEAELITKYRDMTYYPLVDKAIEEVVNECICVGEENDIVKIILDDLELPEKVKQVFENEFNGVLRMLDFKNRAHDIFRRWYIDGRLYFHAIIDEQNPQDGVKELRYIDPRKLRKIREVTKVRANPDQIGGATATVEIPQVVNEYYIYNEQGFDASTGNNRTTPQSSIQGIRISPDTIVHTTSGITDSSGGNVLSYLHKAIKPLNMLKSLEDCTVVYRLTRSSERRVWKIDVGNMPHARAEQYMRDIMTKHKNKITYDSQTGMQVSATQFTNMTEDFWIPVKEGGKGTSVETLPAGEMTGVLDDVLYFQKLLYDSLNVPTNRLKSDDLFSSGLATEVTRDEIGFAKFNFRLRQRFSHLFMAILERQLILKNICTFEEWKSFASDIKFDYVKDNDFAEAKAMALLQSKANVLMLIEPFVGKYISAQYVRKVVLGQSEEDIEEMDAEIANEAGNPQFHPEIFNQEMRPTAGNVPEGSPPPPGQ